MPRSANQKLKLLCLCKILWERTDEEHPLTVPELIQALEAWDIRAERKSIYDDMEALRDQMAEGARPMQAAPENAAPAPVADQTEESPFAEENAAAPSPEEDRKSEEAGE